MTAEDVTSLFYELEANGIKTWLDGGWGVDALLGKQSRLHDDVDIVVQEKDLPALRKILAEKKYKDVHRDDTRAWNFVLGDDQGRMIDVHAIDFDDKGNGIYGPQENGAMYPASSLTGTGIIGGRTVNCLSAEYQIESHSGYKLREKDHQDILALCEKFQIEVPTEYRNSNNSHKV